MAISEGKWKGDASVVELAEDTQLSLTSRVKIFHPLREGIRLVLPRANEPPLRRGGPVFYLVNLGPFDVAVDDLASQQQGNIPAGYACVVLLLDDKSVVGEWAFICSPWSSDTTGTTSTTTQATTTTTLPPTTTTQTTDTTRDPGSTTDATPPGSTISCPECPTETTVATDMVMRFHGRDVKDPATLLMPFPCDPNPLMPWERYGPGAPSLPAAKGDRISVVITCLNEGLDLELTLRSLLEADERPYEIILVDDCSQVSPRSRFESAIQGSRLGPYGRGIFLRHGRRAGVAPSRQSGIRAATGDAVLVIDSHVLLPRDWMARSRAHLAQHPGDIFVPVSTGFDAVGMWCCGASLKFSHSTSKWRAWWQDTRMDICAPIIPAIMGACYLVRLDTLKHVGGWGPGLRGWGLDEEYLCARAWMLGHKVRGMTDWTAKHNYNRNGSRKPKAGWSDQSWEVMYNHCVVTRVILGETAWLRTYNESIFCEDFSHLRSKVASRMRMYEEEILEAQRIVKERSIMSALEMMTMLSKVAKESLRDDSQATPDRMPPAVLTTDTATQAWAAEGAAKAC